MKNPELNQEPQSFNLIEYAGTVTDKSIKTYDELKKQILSSKAFSKFKNQLKEKYKQDKTNLVVLGTGGTFQSAETDKGLAPTGSLQESFEAMKLPYNREEITLNLFELFNYDSSLLTTGEQIRFIAEVLIKLLNECQDFIDGIIITHGTDTMAETANYLSLILGRGLKKPVILTGSQDPARVKNTDAIYHMDNCLKAHEFLKEHGVAEVMVLCGQELVRGSWVEKCSDKDSNAFRSFNGKPLLRVENRLVKNWELSSDALKADPTIPFLPFNGVTRSADIPVQKLADISPQQLAKIIVGNRMSVFTLLGSATCPNTHAEIIRRASGLGKPVFLRSPFSDSVLKPGTYEAGSALKGSNISQVKGTDSFIAAKLNYLWHLLGIQTEHRDGLGEIITKERQNLLYTSFSQNMVGEWF